MDIFIYLSFSFIYIKIYFNTFFLSHFIKRMFIQTHTHTFSRKHLFKFSKNHHMGQGVRSVLFPITGPASSTQASSTQKAMCVSGAKMISRLSDSGRLVCKMLPQGMRGG